ncbi:B3 domain-containing transcription factor VRN1 [Citrus clementina]|nr:B3 domain-containing transcription factor VRN1 [Citrus x clementina]
MAFGKRMKPNMSSPSYFFQVILHSSLEVEDNILCDLKYVNNTTFHVLIFDLTACEINYPYESDESKNEELMVEKNESDDYDEFDLWASLEEMGMCIARKERTVTKEESRRAVKIARSLRPKIPSFMVILQSSDITHNAVYVPGKFANEFFSRDVKSIKIEDDKKREHTLSNNWRRNGGFVLLWAKLMRNNSLQKGDICIFDFVPRNDFLLKLSVFSG